MPNKMERFTALARRVLSLAQEEADRLKHNTIGTEHLLLGLLREEGGIAGRVLRDLGLELHRVQDLVEELTHASVQQSATSAELSPGTKRVLELAVDEARRMGHHYIGTEHLLLGLVHQSDGVAIDVLKRLGISPEEVRRQTRRFLQESPVQSRQGTPMENPPIGETVAAQFHHMSDVRPAPPPPSAVKHIESASYQVVKTIVMKLLDMVGEGKLTLEQAQELLASVQPGLRLTTGMQIWLASLLNQKLEDDTRHVEVIVTNLESDKPVHTLKLPLSDALTKLDQLLLVTVTDNRLESVAFESDTSTIKVEVRIVKE